jgi:hypothetical protein
VIGYFTNLWPSRAATQSPYPDASTRVSHSTASSEKVADRKGCGPIYRQEDGLGIVMGKPDRAVIEVG